MADPNRPSDDVTCPLCFGHGSMRKELLVIRSRDREFRDLLTRYWDEAASSHGGGLDNPFESKEEADATHTLHLHSSGAGVPKD